MSDFPNSFTLVFHAINDDSRPAIVRVRKLLKAALRQYGFRCKLISSASEEDVLTLSDEETKMTVNINQLVLAGNLTGKPELRHTSGGKGVCQLCVAVSRPSRDGSGGVDYFDVETWERLAEVCAEFLDKGSAVLVTGRLRLDRWTAQDGSVRSKVLIVADRVDFLDRPTAREAVPDGETVPY